MRLTRYLPHLAALIAIFAVAQTPADTRPDGRDQHTAPPTPPRPASGVTVRALDHGGATFDAVVIDLRRARLRLVGQTLGPSAVRTFAGLDAWVEGEGERVVVATNAGLFHADHRPVGLHVEQWRTLRPLDRGEGRGNFWLKPNGVFAIGAEGAQLVDTVEWPPPAFAEAPPRLAVQSGPLLLRGGVMHPLFAADSRHRRIRSAVGVVDRHTVVLVRSVGAVTFHGLASALRDGLGCADALYLDGGISGLRAPGVPLDRSGGPYSYGGFLLVTAAQ